MKSSLVLLTVLIDPLTPVIVAIPTDKRSDWIVSPENVTAVPTSPPHTDLISEIPWAVTAIEILEFSIPSNIKGSPLIKLPELS